MCRFLCATLYEPGIGRKPASELSDFIDVDGVLNNGTWAIEMFDKGLRVYHDDLLYKPALEQLKRIVDATGAVIVESSAWRQIPIAYLHPKEWLE